jgi:hypothetical protein
MQGLFKASQGYVTGKMGVGTQSYFAWRTREGVGEEGSGYHP